VIIKTPPTRAMGSYHLVTSPDERSYYSSELTTTLPTRDATEYIESRKPPVHTRSTSTYYLISFDFCTSYLSSLSYIAFAWSSTIKIEMQALGYKVWIDLVDLPPHAWSLEELAVISSSFRLILPHPLFKKVESFERLRMVIATDNLSRIQRSIMMFLNGRKTITLLVII
jgi:hypothetical protein